MVWIRDAARQKNPEGEAEQPEARNTGGPDHLRVDVLGSCGPLQRTSRFAAKSLVLARSWREPADRSEVGLMALRVAAGLFEQWHLRIRAVPDVGEYTVGLLGTGFVADLRAGARQPQ